MADHQLQPGKTVIDAIEHLGRALGYTVKREFPVQGLGTAVDVAFFLESQQTLPLMIFEVESTASGGMANNALKVLSRDSEDFIKPLFFFHIVVSGGSKSERIGNLRRQWGSHNYHIYLLAEGHLTRLANDIFAQQRRISSEIDIPGCMEALSRPEWSGIDMASICDALEALNYAQDYLVSYMYLGLSSEFFSQRLIQLLAGYLTSGDFSRFNSGYPTRLGGISWPMHVGLIIQQRPDLAEEALDTLKWWQEKSSYMTMIGPHFGLDRDYDFLIKNFAPFIWALTCALARAHRPTVQYALSQASIVLRDEKVRDHYFAGETTALWVLHISASLNFPDYYKEAANFLKISGDQIYLDQLTCPKLQFIEDAYEHYLAFSGKIVEIPSREELIDLMNSQTQQRADRGSISTCEHLVMLLLTDQVPDDFDTLGPQTVLQTLYTRGHR